MGTLIGLSETPRALRKLKNGTSLSSVARAVGISVSGASKIFNGHRMPNMRTAVAICQYLEVTLDDLYSAVAEAEASLDTRLIAA